MEPTEAWRKLKLQYETDGDIILADFDAYDHRALGMDYSQVLHNEKKKMGHAFVLAMMLEEQREWEK